MEEFIQVTTATGSAEEAERIARALVDERLAACVQVIGPIRSVYWWKGKVEDAQEWLCLAKTRKAVFPEIEAAIKRMHSYDLPEITAVDIVAGSAEYLKWAGEETGK